MHNHSYENEFNLHVNEISFSYEKMGTKTRFEEEAKGNSEMAYYTVSSYMYLHVDGRRTVDAVLLEGWQTYMYYTTI